jgi:hypothetical protein
MLTRRIYYCAKPILPRGAQIAARRWYCRRKLSKFRHVWPIDQRAAESPKGWCGWPGGKQFAFVLTHDVDTAKGQDRCRDLLALDRDHGFSSAFYFVPERYPLQTEILTLVKRSGFELGVHGLCHDGKLYNSKDEFESRARRINEHLSDWDAVGFRSPAMHHNLEWLHALDIDYDASTFDTDPFEPQPEGTACIFPFWVRGSGSEEGYVELPYTLPQDFTLFVLLGENSIDIWKRKLDWVVEKGGMALVLTHPDYMNFGPGKDGLDEYPITRYRQLLRYVREKYDGMFWHILPREMARFCRSQTAPNEGELRN